ncbi:MAG: glucosyltransferase domain-containing protein [Patescibacteria group bacterium]
MIKKYYLALFLVFLLSLFLRFYNLESIPPAITHDEIYYAAEAKSIAVSGSDTSGTWRPWSLQPAHALFAELPGTIMAPAAFIFPNSPVLAARATHAFLGSLFPLILAVVALSLFKDKKLALITAMITAFNPWFFQFSRMGFDAILSLFFYFLGLLILLNTKKYWRLLSLPILFLGFFQYQGLKIIFPPLIFLFVAYLFSIDYDKKKSLFKNIIFQKSSLIILLLSLLLFITYIFNLSSQSAAGRVDDLIFFNRDLLSQELFAIKQASIPNFSQRIFTNAISTVASYAVKGYVSSFDPILLFVHGETVRNPSSVWTVGNFHLFDAILILIGFVYAWTLKKWRKAMIFIVSLILIAPLPVAINSVDIWVLYRSSLLYPLLIILSSIGFYFLWQKNRLIKFFLIIVYLLSISSFLYQYFYRYPVYSTKGKYFAKRVLANHIKRSPDNQKYIILADESEFLFSSLLVFNNLINKENILAINTAMQNQDYNLSKINIQDNCIDLSQIDKASTIVADDSVTFCADAVKDQVVGRNTSIVSLLDGGWIYRIYNDQVCGDYELERFLKLEENLLAVEKLNQEIFCKNFLTNNVLTSEACEAASGIVIDKNDHQSCPDDTNLIKKIDAQGDKYCCL